MKNISKKFPEIKNSEDCSLIPWDNAVVWLESAGEAESYNWIESEEIRYTSWTNGVVSIIPHPDSMLSSSFHSIIINSAEIFVGKNVKTGN